MPLRRNHLFPWRATPRKWPASRGGDCLRKRGGTRAGIFVIGCILETFAGKRFWPMPDASRAIRVEVEREDGGCWLAEVTALSGALAYGQSREEAIARVEALALRILAERLEHGEPTPELDGVFEAA